VATDHAAFRVIHHVPEADGELYGARSAALLSFSEVDCTRFVGSTGGCIGLLTACSRVVCTTHRSRVTQPRLGPFA